MSQSKFQKPAQPYAAGLKPPARVAVIGLLLAAATLLVYWPVGGFDFVNYDDPAYFYENARVLSGLSWQNIVWAFQTADSASWYPLMWLSFLCDATLFGRGAAGPHLVNLFLHTANVVLLLCLLRRLTGSLGRSALVAGLFALHPLHVESVAWITERKDVLSTFFGLLSLIFYARYSQNENSGFTSATGPGAGSGRSAIAGFRSVAYWLSLLFFALGLLAKPMLVTIPCLMFLLDYWPLNRFPPRALRPAMFRAVAEKIPFFLLGAADALVTFLVHKQSGLLVASSLQAKIENALVSYARYLGKTFWPLDLALPYPYPGGWPAGMVVFSVMLLVGLSGVAVWQMRRRPYLFVGWFWFVGMLFPVIGIIRWGSQSIADRFTYVPLMGLYVGLVWGVVEFWRGRCLSLKVAAVLVACVFVALAWRTENQLSHWQNTETLFRHTLAVTDKNLAAYNNLGQYLIAVRGRLDEAIDMFQAALRIRPDFSEAHNNLGGALRLKGKAAEAIDHYLQALEVRTDFVDAHFNLGVILMEQGRPAEAKTNFIAALSTRPEYPEAHHKLGVILAAEGDTAGAVAHWREAVRLRPTYAKALNDLAWTLATDKNPAIRNGAEAVLLAERSDRATQGKNPDAVDTLAAAQAECGRFAEAAATAQRAIALAVAVKNEKLAADIRARAELYRSGKPFRE